MSLDTEDETKKWYFSVEDFDGEIEHMGDDGESVDSDEAKANPFVGTKKQALVEADRRADEWEIINDRFCSNVTTHSLGKI